MAPRHLCSLRRRAFLSLSAKTFKMRALSDMAGLSSATFDAFKLERETQAIGRQLQSFLDQGEGLGGTSFALGLRACATAAGTTSAI